MYKFALLGLTASLFAFALLAPAESRTKTRYSERYPAEQRRTIPKHVYEARQRARQRAASDRGSSDWGASDRGASDRGASDRGASDRGASDRGASDRGASGPKTTEGPVRSECAWTCGDGSCIYLHERCDHMHDCPDRTDEFNCAENSRCSYKCSGRRIPPKCYKTCDGGNTTTRTRTISIFPASSRRETCRWKWSECMLTFGGECGPGVQTVTSDVAGCSATEPSLFPEEIECYVSCGVPNNRTMKREMQRDIEKVIEAHRSLERTYRTWRNDLTFGSFTTTDIPPSPDEKVDICNIKGIICVKRLPYRYTL